MTYDRQISPKRTQSKSLAYENVQLLDVAGPLQVFATANDLARRDYAPAPYQLAVVAPAAPGVTTSAGLPLVVQPLPPPEAALDTLIVAGGFGVNVASDDASLVAWLRQRAASARRVASVCSGAFLLAAAGLLTGRRVATHWTRCAELARRYPDITVEENPIFICDRGVWTSAGITAGIDLALALVEEDLGRATALAVARHLVVFLKRPGGQSQFSAALSLQHSEDRFGALHSWIGQNLGADLAIPDIARRAGMSERTFLRRYRAGDRGDAGQSRSSGCGSRRRSAGSASRRTRSSGSPSAAASARKTRCAAASLRVAGVAPQDYRAPLFALSAAIALA